MTFTQANLPGLFQSVTDALTKACSELNQADARNQNHGDHMVEIFQIATRAAQEKQEADLSDAMDYASLLLKERTENDSAQVYARGLTRLAGQFRQKQVTLDELVRYVRSYLQESDEQKNPKKGAAISRAGDLLKAMLSALAEWEQVEAGQPDARDGLDMGYLFGVGMAYMQAKTQGGGRLEILAETVVSASPLSRIPYRRQSGKLVILKLLDTMRVMPGYSSGANSDED